MGCGLENNFQVNTFIKYEEYISNPIDYIKKILNFLEIKDIEPQLLRKKIKRNL